MSGASRWIPLLVLALSSCGPPPPATIENPAHRHVDGEWDVSDWNGLSGSMGFATSGRYLAYGPWGEWTGAWSWEETRHGRSILTVDEESEDGETLRWSVLLDPRDEDTLFGFLKLDGGFVGMFRAKRLKAE